MKGFIRQQAFIGGVQVPALGMGTWYLGESQAAFEKEKEAVGAGIAAGITLIDTAEMYGEGAAEELVGEAIRPFDRKRLFLVSKVYPHNAGKNRIEKSCDQSLKRLKTEYLDLYLLHWRGSIPLEETIQGMETLVRKGKIRQWGVSNFDVDDMEELWSLPGGRRCAVNQVLYHIGSRGVEYSLLPWMRERAVAMMAYCPMAQGSRGNARLYEHPVLRQTADAHHTGVPQIMLAFLLAQKGVIPIPRTGNPAHMRKNRGAAEILLTEEELAALDRAFPAPDRKVPLEVR